MNIKEHRKLVRPGMPISGKIIEKDMGILTYPIRNHNSLYKRGGLYWKGTSTSLGTQENFIP